jgi:hypothetical protein
VFIIANDKWMLFFRGWRPIVVRTWIGGIETAILKGTPEQQVEELKSRLRYTGINNMITNPAWVDRQLEILRLKKEKDKK